MPIPVIVIGAVILFFALLCLLRIRIILTLNSEVALAVRVLCFKIPVLPRRKKVKWKNYSPKKAAKIKAKKAKKEAKKAAKRAARKKAHERDGSSPEATKKKTTLLEKLRLVRALCAALFRKTHKHLRLHAARLHLSIATGDAAKTAVLYGAVCQALVYLLALLDRITHLKAAEPEVAVRADYLSEKTSADVRIVLSLRVGGLLLILFSVAFAFIKAKLDQKQRRKQKEKKAAKAAREKQAQKG